MVCGMHSCSLSNHAMAAYIMLYHWLWACKLQFNTQRKILFTFAIVCGPLLKQELIEPAKIRRITVFLVSPQVKYFDKKRVFDEYQKKLESEGYQPLPAEDNKR